jgi:hypothetical protein
MVGVNDNKEFSKMLKEFQKRIDYLLDAHDKRIKQFEIQYLKTMDSRNKEMINAMNKTIKAFQKFNPSNEFAKTMKNYDMTKIFANSIKDMNMAKANLAKVNPSNKNIKDVTGTYNYYPSNEVIKKFEQNVSDQFKRWFENYDPLKEIRAKMESDVTKYFSNMKQQNTDPSKNTQGRLDEFEPSVMKAKVLKRLNNESTNYDDENKDNENNDGDEDEDKDEGSSNTNDQNEVNDDKEAKRSD